MSVVGSRYQGSRIAACTSSGDIGVPVSKESIGLNSNVNSPSECNGQGFVQRAVGLRRAAPARTPPLVESGAVLPEDQVGQVIERFRVDLQKSEHGFELMVFLHLQPRAPGGLLELVRGEMSNGIVVRNSGAIETI